MSVRELQRPDPFWWDRWQAWQAVVRESNVRRSTIEPFRKLFELLLEFGTKQFSYFFYGFGGHDDLAPDHPALAEPYPDHTLEPDKDRRYPPQYVLRWTFDQLAYDYAIMQQAMLQRQHGTERERETLKVADRWGQALIAPAAHKLLPGRAPLVVTYFHPMPNIRVMPYADVALIGIPMSAVGKGARRDLFVMGHELGHHLYWHGMVQDKPLYEIVAQTLIGHTDQPIELIAPWMEEIFADIFCIVAGQRPAIVHGAMAMVWDNNPGRRYRDDGVYPPDAIRPRIFADTLAEIATRLDIEAAVPQKVLDERHQEWRRDFKLNPKTESPQQLDAEKKTLDRLQAVQNVLEQTDVVPQLVGLLSDGVYSLDVWREHLTRDDADVLARSRWMAERWPAMLPEIRGLFGQLFAKVEPLELPDSGMNLPIKPIVPLNLERRHVRDWYRRLETHMMQMAAGAEKWPEGRKALRDRVTSERKWTFKTARDKVLAGGSNATRSVSSEKWTEVFRAGGWTIEGPETRPTMDMESTYAHR